MGVDFGTTAQAYARYRQGYPPDFTTRLEAIGVAWRGRRVVDLGAGTGALARALALRGAHVVAVDRSPSMLAAGRDLPGGDRVRWVEASAEATGLPEGSADLVTASQCWHWFDRDAAAAEARRLLGGRGRVLICHLDWLDSDVIRETLGVSAAAGLGRSVVGLPGVSHGLYPAWLGDLSAAGFGHLETFSYDVDLHYTHEAWRGRLQASAHGGASLPPEEAVAFDRALAEVLSAFPDPVPVPHRIFALTGILEAA